MLSTPLKIIIGGTYKESANQNEFDSPDEDEELSCMDDSDSIEFDDNYLGWSWLFCPDNLLGKKCSPIISQLSFGYSFDLERQL